MKKSILVTGIAGSGKSLISEYLNKLGYKAYESKPRYYQKAFAHAQVKRFWQYGRNSRLGIKLEGLVGK